MFKIGEVKIPTDQDFYYVKKLCEQDGDWKQEYSSSKTSLKVFSKKNELSSFQMIKVKADFDDVTASTLYDVIQDGDFR